MDDQTIICRCEEVTAGEIRRALEAGLTTPGEIRKYTRAGMGSCQGRTCQKLLVGMIRQYTKSDEIPEETIKARAPMVKVTLGELADWKEED